MNYQELKEESKDLKLKLIKLSKLKTKNKKNIEFPMSLKLIHIHDCDIYLELNVYIDIGFSENSYSFENDLFVTSITYNSQLYNGESLNMEVKSINSLITILIYERNTTDENYHIKNLIEKLILQYF